MELQVIENELAALEREIQVLTSFGHNKQVCISGSLTDVADYVSALKNIKGHVELAKMAVDRLKGEDEKECIQDHR